MMDMKLQDIKMADQTAGRQIATLFDKYRLQLMHVTFEQITESSCNLCIMLTSHQMCGLNLNQRSIS